MTRNSLQMTKQKWFGHNNNSTLNYVNVVNSYDFETVTKEPARYYDFNQEPQLKNPGIVILISEFFYHYPFQLVFKINVCVSSVENFKLILKVN